MCRRGGAAAQERAGVQTCDWRQARLWCCWQPAAGAVGHGRGARPHPGLLAGAALVRGAMCRGAAGRGWARRGSDVPHREAVWKFRIYI